MKHRFTLVAVAACTCLSVDTAAKEPPSGYGTFADDHVELSSSANGKGLVIAAPIVFGAAWLGSVPLALESSMFGIIPVAGPFIALGAHDLESTIGMGLVLDGIVQIAGLGMLTAGIAIFEWEVDVKRASHPLRVGAGANGISVDGTF